MERWSWDIQGGEVEGGERMRTLTRQLEDWRETVSEGEEDVGIYLRNGKSSALVEIIKKRWRERKAISRGPCALTPEPRFCLRHGE